jgi:membrane fusion protein, heavy metal efflux system
MTRTFIRMSLLMPFFWGCTSKEAHEHGHERDASGLEPLAYTVYTKKTELFVEFKPLVLGQSSRFATHLTVLGDQFKALTEGTVTVSLLVGGKGIRYQIDAPSSPGIFRLALSPTVSGKGKLVFDILSKGFTDQVIIENVQVYPDEATAQKNTAAPKLGDITYLKEQAWKVEFANEEVHKQAFHEIIPTSGQILSAISDEHIITAKATGIVKFAGTQTIVGTHVNTGTTLFNITGGDLAEGNIDAQYKETKVNYDKAKANYDRAKELAVDKIISEKDLLQAKVEFENQQTQLSMVSKNYSSTGQNIKAPMEGFVKSIFVKEGQFVTVGTPLATLSKNRKLTIQCMVSQKYFDRISTITSANFKTRGNGETYDTRQLNGKVFYGKSTALNVPFIPITFEIDNMANLVPGSVIEVFLRSFPIPDALVVPVTALVEEQGNFFVYVQISGESFEKREVKLGGNDGKYVQVLSGLEEGERVVTKGAYQIKLSTASGTLPAHGHEH